jgi:UDP-N-acetylmuramoylalanine--D-glutamate ligase
LKSFTGLAHRLELVREVYGVRYYNDSLATIPDAVLEALETFDPEVETLIAGGFDRGSDYSSLGNYLVKSSVKNLILLGPSGKKIWEAVVAAGGEKSIKKIEVETMDKAVFFASEETSPGKICLLSPGAASFGLFLNYKDRGDQFKRAVSALDVN